MDKFEFYKDKPNNKIWSVVRIPSEDGEMLFSFDKKTIFNIWGDYPHKLTKRQQAIFAEEYPYWRKFFDYRFKEGDQSSL